MKEEKITPKEELETLGYPFTQEAYDLFCKFVHKMEGVKLLTEAQQEIMQLKRRIFELEKDQKIELDRYNAFAQKHNELLIVKEILITQLQTQLLQKKV
jgi:hypothetical protein